MTDDLDKTVFKQPMPGGDRGAVRPSPGRRTGRTELGRRPGHGVSQPEVASTQAGPRGRRGNFDNVKFQTSLGLNPLVNSAATLIAVFEKVRDTVRHDDVGGLHKRLVFEIRQFEQKAKDENIKPEIILAARYLLCSVLDEAVMHTPWGGESAWAQRTLLSIFHNETFGGEKCFAILERMRSKAAENCDMLELFYLCLSLGFEGRYRLIPRGREQLETLRDELYRTIRTYRGEGERSLSPKYQGLGHGRRTLSQVVPMWVVASVFGLLLFLSYGGFSLWMRSASAPVLTEFAELGDTAASTTLTTQDTAPLNQGPEAETD